MATKTTATETAKKIESWIDRVNQSTSQLPGELSKIEMELNGFDPDEMPEMAEHFGSHLFTPGAIERFWFCVQHGNVKLQINSVQVQTITTWTRKSPNQKAEAIQ